MPDTKMSLEIINREMTTSERDRLASLSRQFTKLSERDWIWRSFRLRLAVCLFLMLGAVAVGCALYMFKPGSNSPWYLLLYPFLLAIPTALVFVASAAIRLVRAGHEAAQAARRARRERQPLSPEPRLVKEVRLSADQAWDVPFDDDTTTFLLRVEPRRYVWLYTQQLLDFVGPDGELDVKERMRLLLSPDDSILSIEMSGQKLASPELPIAWNRARGNDASDPDFSDKRWLRQFAVFAEHELPDGLLELMENARQSRA